MFNGYNQPTYESDTGRDNTLKKSGHAAPWNYSQSYYSNSELQQTNTLGTWQPKLSYPNMTGKCACVQCQQGPWYHKDVEPVVPSSANPDMMLLGPGIGGGGSSEYPMESFNRPDAFIRNNVQASKKFSSCSYPTPNPQVYSHRLPNIKPTTSEFSNFDRNSDQYMRMFEASSYSRKPAPADHRQKYWDGVNGAFYPTQQYQYPPPCRYPPYNPPFYYPNSNQSQPYQHPQHPPQQNGMQQYYGIVPNPMRQMEVAQPIAHNYLKQDSTSKISPLRLMRKKKLAESMGQPSPPRMTQSADNAPALDVRRFLATWDDEDEESPSVPQMVVLDCQDINAEQAELLRLYESSTSVRLIQQSCIEQVSKSEQSVIQSTITEPVLEVQSVLNDVVPPTNVPADNLSTNKEEDPVIVANVEEAAVEIPLSEELNGSPLPSPASTANSQDSLPVLADLPTSEYRKNKFLDYDQQSFPLLPIRPTVAEPMAVSSCRPQPVSNPIEVTEKSDKKNNRKRSRKPTIKFSIQKSHDLKISLRVLNDSKSHSEQDSNNEVVNRNEEGDSRDLITLSVDGGEDDTELQDMRSKKAKKLKRRKLLEHTYSVSSEEHCNDATSDGFQVEESVDSAKIKLTFKRRKGEREQEEIPKKRKKTKRIKEGKDKPRSVCSDWEAMSPEEPPAADTTTDFNGQPPPPPVEPKLDTPLPSPTQISITEFPPNLSLTIIPNAGSNDNIPLFSAFDQPDSSHGNACLTLSHNSNTSSPKISSSCHITSPRTSTDSIERELQAIWNGRVQDSKFSEDDRITSNENVVDFYTEDISTGPINIEPINQDGLQLSNVGKQRDGLTIEKEKTEIKDLIDESQKSIICNNIRSERDDENSVHFSISSSISMAQTAKPGVLNDENEHLENMSTPHSESWQKPIAKPVLLMGNAIDNDDANTNCDKISETLDSNTAETSQVPNLSFQNGQILSEVLQQPFSQNENHLLSKNSPSSNVVVTNKDNQSEKDNVHTFHDDHIKNSVYIEDIKNGSSMINDGSQKFDSVHIKDDNQSKTIENTHCPKSIIDNDVNQTEVEASSEQSSISEIIGHSTYLENECDLIEKNTIKNNVETVAETSEVNVEVMEPTITGDEDSKMHKERLGPRTPEGSPSFFIHSLSPRYSDSSKSPCNSNALYYSEKIVQDKQITANGHNIKDVDSIFQVLNSVSNEKDENDLTIDAVKLNNSKDNSTIDTFEFNNSQAKREVNSPTILNGDLNNSTKETEINLSLDSITFQTSNDELVQNTLDTLNLNNVQKDCDLNKIMDKNNIDSSLDSVDYKSNENDNGINSPINSNNTEEISDEYVENSTFTSVNLNNENLENEVVSLFDATDVNIELGIMHLDSIDLNNSKEDCDMNSIDLSNRVISEEVPLNLINIKSESIFSPSVDSVGNNKREMNESIENSPCYSTDEKIKNEEPQLSSPDSGNLNNECDVSFINLKSPLNTPDLSDLKKDDEMNLPVSAGDLDVIRDQKYIFPVIATDPKKECKITSLDSNNLKISFSLGFSNVCNILDKMEDTCSEDSPSENKDLISDSDKSSTSPTDVIDLNIKEQCKKDFPLSLVDSNDIKDTLSNPDETKKEKVENEIVQFDDVFNLDSDSGENEKTESDAISLLNSPDQGNAPTSIEFPQPKQICNINDEVLKCDVKGLPESVPSEYKESIEDCKTIDHKTNLPISVSSTIVLNSNDINDNIHDSIKNSETLKTDQTKNIEEKNFSADDDNLRESISKTFVIFNCISPLSSPDRHTDKMQDDDTKIKTDGDDKIEDIVLSDNLNDEESMEFMELEADENANIIIGVNDLPEYEETINTEESSDNINLELLSPHFISESAGCSDVCADAKTINENDLIEEEEYIVVAGDYICPVEDGVLVEITNEDTESIDIKVEDIPLPPGDAPQENCFDYQKWVDKNCNENSLPSDTCVSPFTSEVLGMFRNPSPPSTPRMVMSPKSPAQVEVSNLLKTELGELEVESDALPDEAKFQHVMESCLANARKFLSGETDEDEVKIRIEEPGDNVSRRDVLLSSFEAHSDLDIGCEPSSTEITMAFSPFNTVIASETLPVDNWPYLEEEVPLSPQWTSVNDDDDIPLQGNEGIPHEVEVENIIPECSDSLPIQLEDVLEKDSKCTTRKPDRLPRIRRRTLDIACNKKVKRKKFLSERERTESDAEVFDYKCHVPLDRLGLNENKDKNKISWKTRRKSMESLKSEKSKRNYKSEDFQGLKWQPKVVLYRLSTEKEVLSKYNISKNKNITSYEQNPSIVDKSQIFSDEPKTSNNLPIKEKVGKDSIKSPSKNIFQKSQRVHSAHSTKGCEKKAALSPNNHKTQKFFSNKIQSNAIISESQTKEKLGLLSIPKNKQSMNDDEIKFNEKNKVEEEKSKCIKNCNKEKLSSKVITTKVDSIHSQDNLDIQKHKPCSKVISHNILKHENILKHTKTQAVCDINKDVIKKCDSGRGQGFNDKTELKKVSESASKRCKQERNKVDTTDIGPIIKKSSQKDKKNKVNDKSATLSKRTLCHSFSIKDECKTQASKKVFTTGVTNNIIESSDDNAAREENNVKVKASITKKMLFHSSGEINNANNPKLDEDNGENSKPWVCAVCGFDDVKKQQSHIQEHAFHCQGCHLAFISEDHFIKHLSRKHEDIRKVHHCLLCELSFDTIDSYNVHLQTREHTHLEQVEKSTIHTLFSLLCGESCPVLGPVKEKPEWLPNQAGTVHFYHQATPLSLATQYWKKKQNSSLKKQ